MDQVAWNDASEVLATLVFLAQLGALALSDAATFRLPLRINLAFLATGLLLGGAAFDTPLQDRAIGAAAGFLALSLVAWIYRILRKREGIGGGDPIMLAGLGAWFGWQLLPMTVLLASMLGVVVALVRFPSKGSEGRWCSLRLPLGALFSVAAVSLIAVGCVFGGCKPSYHCVIAALETAHRAVASSVPGI